MGIAALTASDHAVHNMAVFNRTIVESRNGAGPIAGIHICIRNGQIPDCAAAVQGGYQSDTCVGLQFAGIHSVNRMAVTINDSLERHA